MSWIRCKCGNTLHDNTDNISYKGYILSDKEYFSMLDLADEMIESSHNDREELAMTFRRSVGIGDNYIRLKEMYQCPVCGRMLIEISPGNFCFFAPEEHDEMHLLDFEAGEKREIIHRSKRIQGNTGRTE